MLVGLTVGLTVFAQAQTGATYKVNIPFDFIVGEKSFSAGNYSLEFGRLQGDRNNFVIRSITGKQSAAIVFGIPKYSDAGMENGSLVFNVSNDRHYLSEVNTPQTSVELYNSRSKEKTRKTGKKVEVALLK